MKDRDCIHKQILTYHFGEGKRTAISKIRHFNMFLFPYVIVEKW